MIFFARYEASQFGSKTIESEHFLLGLIREDKNLTNRFLRSSSSIEAIRKEVSERSTVREKVSTSIDLPLSEECRRILAYANEEAERLNHRHIGTEHLLLAILREEKCVAAEILFSRGLRLEVLREELARSVPDRVSELGMSMSVKAGVTNSETLVGALVSHGFTSSKEHLGSAIAAGNQQDWNMAHAELQLFLETLIDETSERLKGESVAFPIFEGFDWRLSLRSLRSGLSADEDWKFRLELTVLLAEVLLKRFEQRLNA